MSEFRENVDALRWRPRLDPDRLRELTAAFRSTTESFARIGDAARKASAAMTAMNKRTPPQPED